jgi:hypothetical protein
VYIDSGFQAERDQSLNDGDHFTHYCTEAAVVLFPVVEKAAASLTTSAQQWPTCREYTHAQSNSHWTVAQITNANYAPEHDDN